MFGHDENSSGRQMLTRELPEGKIYGDCTMLLINDPWPPKRGDIYGIILGDYLRYNPTALRYVLPATLLRLKQDRRDVAGCVVYDRCLNRLIGEYELHHYRASTVLTLLHARRPEPAEGANLRHEHVPQ